MLILIIILCLLAGMAFGIVFRKNARVIRVADKCSVYAIYVLLFVLGAGLGQNAELFSSLPSLGLTALALTLCATVGSALVMRLVQPLLKIPPHTPAAPGGGEALPGEKPAAKPAPAASAGPSPLWSSARILFFFLLGIGLGRAGILPAWLAKSDLVSYALYFLVFCVGVGLGGELKAFLILRDMHFKILLVPLGTIAGSLAGAAVAAAFLPGLNVNEGLAVGSGMGYYSLSSVMISQATGNAALGSIALLSNVFRELLGILTAPVLARFVGPLAPVGVAGSPAMDTCLPAIARFCGERYAIVAVFSGVALTIAVPFIVSFFLEWVVR